jgi:hypothetical protein
LIVKEIGSALGAAHAHGLIHRDVKPGNILLDDEEHAALTDFGVAREVGSRGNPDPLTLAGAGLTAGTPQYMAPEQLREADLDGRADLYALGVVLYEMLTGRTPHLGDSQFEIGAAVLGGQIIPPSALNVDIPRAVEDVLMRALSLAPEDRYATMQSFVEALADAVTHPARMAPDLWLVSLLRLRNKRNSSHTQAVDVVGRTDQSRRRRWLALELLALTVLLTIGGWWIALAGALPPARLDSRASRGDGSGGQPTVTLITQATVTVSATANSAPTATGAGQPTATPAPSSTAAPAPPPLLTLGALHLTHVQGNQCAGAQTIANTGAQQLTWQWDSIQPNAHPSFLYGVNTTAQFGGLPSDVSPGLAAGKTDLLNVQMRCTALNYTVTLHDGLGRTQQFTMISD